ncbi:MAG: hypothetical protein WBH99_13230 [Azovibrio sp.]|uniref:hypothetical protein n=1 Tax=Azovibrio sp. TaxID=1872673 RepID=UPI003C71F689
MAKVAIYQARPFRGSARCGHDADLAGADARQCGAADPQAIKEGSPLYADEMGGLTPSQLRYLESKCREVNADFFGMRERLVKVGRAVAQQGFPEPSVL